MMASFESLRQTVVDQAQLRFVAEQTSKRRRLDPEVQLLITDES